MEKVNTESGAQGNAENGVVGDNTEHSGQVPYDKHQRLLEQRKKDQEKLRETQSQLESLLKEKQDRERQELEAQGNYKKMLEQERVEKDQLKSRLTEFEQRWTNSLKLSSVVSKLPGKVEKTEYLNFLDLEKVAINPETNDVDVATAEAVASEFVKRYPELIKKEGKSLPNISANGSNQPISYDQWKKLPLKEKMKYKPTDIGGK